MFNWLKSKDSLMDKERNAFAEIAKTSCDKDKEIAELRSELSKSKRDIERLRDEVDQNYIKDAVKSEHGNRLEYIDKLGKVSVKVYEFTQKFNDYPFIRYYTERTLKETWTPSQCIELRDFLVKNFPLESKKTLEGDEAIEFLKKDGADNV